MFRLAVILLCLISICSGQEVTNFPMQESGSRAASVNSEHAPEPASVRPYSIAPSQCPYTENSGKDCAVHWRPLLLEIAIFNSFEDEGNVYTGYWYRYETTHGKWFHRYIDSVADYRFSRWSDDNPMLDDYVGHPMMGSITNYIWIANDPRGTTLDFKNSSAYWKSRARAFAFSTVYSTLWKIGPFGEAAIGHNGDHYYYIDNGKWTNGTGFVSLVTTPVGGLGWTIVEDALDRYAIRRLETVSQNEFWLTAISFLNPSRSLVNLMRFKAPWYRDTRPVLTTSFWGKRNTSPGELPGGDNELGFWAGMSFISGHVFGYAKDVYLGTWNVRYSHLIVDDPRWDLRYSPEATPVVVLSEPRFFPSNDPTKQRMRIYGGGLSPMGFQMGFHPHGKYQPFVSTNGGFLYFGDRVLSPQASQFMLTIDLGGGVQIFHTNTNAVTLGYRYQHMSNANISARNPGTDSNIFYVGVSRFR